MTNREIKLSVTARDRLRKELRNSPSLRDHISDPTTIVRMTKDELLALAEKCGISVKAIVEDERKHGKGLESLLTPEEMERWNHSEKYPAFTGVLQLPIKIDLAGKSCERLLRVKYSHTPEWEYYDVHKKQLMKGWEGWVTECEIRTSPSKRYRDEHPTWVKVEAFSDIGLLSDDQEDAIDALIDRECRAEDRRRRRAAGLIKGKSSRTAQRT